MATSFQTSSFIRPADDRYDYNDDAVKQSPNVAVNTKKNNFPFQDTIRTMPTLALPQLSSIPEFEELRSFHLPYPLRRSPSNLPFSQTTQFEPDISPGRSTVCLTFHLLQAEGTVNRTTQYQVDRLSKWSHLIGDIERTVENMGGFHILKIHCADGKAVKRTLRRGERVWERCSRTKEAGKLQERVKIEVIMSSAS